jgi:hypothetical protein
MPRRSTPSWSSAAGHHDRRSAGPRTGGRTTGYHAARRGTYRIIYRINEDKHTVEIHSIRHRRDSYRALPGNRQACMQCARGWFHVVERRLGVVQVAVISGGEDGRIRA